MPDCHATHENETCSHGTCRARCAHEAVDELLRQPELTFDETELLLDFRWLLCHRVDADTTLKLFCELRRQMEARNYLAFYRLRRWLENHLVAEVRSCPAAEAELIPVKLNHFCPVAVRRACICEAVKRGVAPLAPRLEFRFQAVPAPVDSVCEHSSGLVAAH